MSLPSNIVQYLERIDVSINVMSRIQELFSLTQDLLPNDQKIGRAFISEVTGKEGRIYESAWFFSSDFMSEAHNFMTEDSVDFYRFTNAIALSSLKRTDFHPGEASLSSRVSVAFMGTAGSGLSSIRGELKASGTNCEFLYRIMKEIMAPNSASPSPK
ncbi:hypothetical protein [Micromonospora sp. NBC_01796]|uniref:hypothetical protein n=1 Tax=Micromonospora sp. NBC_01796 TaxID=2975987 RepID=UPI002DDC2A6D|nr:hypothetical protein [Micromonospora sp. NBC_01796]WSA83188.1 hypothetical protein OIE47_22550 [Micromonospora sp. NBC_01796]